MRNYIPFLLFYIAVSVSIGFGASFNEEYDAAYASFQSAKTRAEIEASAKAFENLSKRDDGLVLRANVYFWQGECWYKLGEYLKALALYEKALLYPMSYKEEDARYKTAMCYVQLKWTKAARSEIERFMRDYANSKHVPTLRNHLAELK